MVFKLLKSLVGNSDDGLDEARELIKAIFAEMQRAENPQINVKISTLVTTMQLRAKGGSKISTSTPYAITNDFIYPLISNGELERSLQDHVKVDLGNLQ